MSNAMIWGASGGIGRAVTERLIQEKWNVYTAVRDTANSPSDTVQDYEFDALDPQSFANVSRLLSMETEQIDLMLYAVGSIAYNKIDHLTLEDWQATMDTNLTGAVLATQNLIPLLAKQAHLIFIGAYLDHLVLPKMGAYATAKAGLAQFTLNLAKENRKKRITLVRPGAVDTRFWDQISLKLPSDAKSPDDVAQSIYKHHMSTNSGDLNL